MLNKDLIFEKKIRQNDGVFITGTISLLEDVIVTVAGKRIVCPVRPGLGGGIIEKTKIVEPEDIEEYDIWGQPIYVEGSETGNLIIQDASISVVRGYPPNEFKFNNYSVTFGPASAPPPTGSFEWVISVFLDIN